MFRSEKWFQEYCDQIHRKKIENIMKKKGRNRDDADFGSKGKRKGVKSMDSFQLYVENHSVIKKITEITKRANKYIQESGTLPPKSLNKYLRKGLEKEILHNNKALQEKILTQKSALSLKKMNEEYAKTSKIKQNLSRKQDFFSMQAKCKTSKKASLEIKPKRNSIIDQETLKPNS